VNLYTSTILSRRIGDQGKVGHILFIAIINSLEYPNKKFNRKLTRNVKKVSIGLLYSAKFLNVDVIIR